MVLHDHGVSRRHARILGRGGRHYVVDLNSANGTLLNGKAISPGKEQELRRGERLAIGGVEFLFEPLAPVAVDVTQPMPVYQARPQRTSTRISRLQTELEMRAIEEENTGRHRTLSEGELAAPSPTATLSEMTAVSELTDVSETTAVSERTAVAAPPRTQTVVDGDGDTSSITMAASRPPVRAAASPQVEAGLTAAERARLRRERGQTLGAQLRHGWAQLSPRGKSFAGVLTGLIIVTAVATVLSVFRPAQRVVRPTGPEPTELGMAPLTQSFGLGEGVTWSQPDLKAFRFEFASPTRAVALLHYQARDIRQDEVSISLNGVELGWVPADNAMTDERELTQLLPLGLVRRSEPNHIAFDNVLNPPGEESWRVWNVYVEVVPVPELPAEQLLAKASEEATAALRFYQQKGVGSENLFKSWKLYRSAWITLEALDPKPELYEEVQYQLAQTASELDQQCRKLMLAFQRSLQYRDGDQALATVEEVMRRFPTTEHRCHNLALEKAIQYDLPI